MAHVRQEGTLGSAGRFGRLRCRPLGFFHGDAVGNVDGNSQDGRLAFVVDRRRRKIHPQMATVLGHELHFVTRSHPLAALAGEAASLTIPRKSG